MLESLLAECVADIVREKNNLSQEDMESLEIEISRFAKAKIGKENFYMASCKASGALQFDISARAFYVSEKRVASKAAERRNASIDRLLED